MLTSKRLKTSTLKMSHFRTELKCALQAGGFPFSFNGLRIQSPLNCSHPQNLMGAFRAQSNITNCLETNKLDEHVHVWTYWISCRKSRRSDAPVLRSIHPGPERAARKSSPAGTRSGKALSLRRRSFGTFRKCSEARWAPPEDTATGEPKIRRSIFQRTHVGPARRRITRAMVSQNSTMAKYTDPEREAVESCAARSSADGADQSWSATTMNEQPAGPDVRFGRTAGVAGSS